MRSESVVLYIYREGAVVEEERSLLASTQKSESGMLTLKLDNISKEIHESTFRLLSEQELRGYSVHEITSPLHSSLSKLLKPLIGKKVTVQSVRKSKAGSQEVTRSGLLINIDTNDYVALRSDDTLRIVREDVTELSSSADGVLSNIVEQPYIEVVIAARSLTATPDALHFSYHTAGMSWRLAYDVTLSDDYSSLSIVGKLAVKNDTGVAFEQALVRVVDGDLTEIMRLSQPPPPQQQQQQYEGLMQQRRSIEESRVRGSEYETYELPGKLTIEKTDALQFLRFFKEDSIQSSRRYVLYTDNPDYAQLTIAWENSSGALLPPGVYMVSRRKADNDMELLGSAAVDSIPMGRKVQMEMGSVFSIRGRREITERTSDTQRQDSPGVLFDVYKYRLTVHNDRDSDIDLVLREQLLAENWIIKDSSYSIVGKDARTDFQFQAVKRKPNSEERETRVATATLFIPALSTAVAAYTVEYEKPLGR